MDPNECVDIFCNFISNDEVIEEFYITNINTDRIINSSQTNFTLIGFYQLFALPIIERNLTLRKEKRFKTIKVAI